ncbi:MAG: DUF3791 domain-containing protein [Proteobacteria bacterium]|nr:DUF3791 domain-containing protein [Pseudomonadota bacterium]
MDNKQFVFIVYMVHVLSDAWKKSTTWVYRILKESGILDDYLIPCYDVLHTQGNAYLIEDISDYLREKGYKL